MWALVEIATSKTIENQHNSVEKFCCFGRVGSDICQHDFVVAQRTWFGLPCQKGVVDYSGHVGIGADVGIPHGFYMYMWETKYG